MTSVADGVTGVTGAAAEVVRHLRTLGIADSDWRRVLGDPEALEAMAVVCRSGLDLDQSPFIVGYRPGQADRLGLMLAGSGADRAEVEALVQHNLGDRRSLIQLLGLIEPRQAWALVLWYDLDSTRSLGRPEAARRLGLAVDELDRLVAEALKALRPHIKLPPE
ncbi:MAG TPA: hypothetical protein VLI05_07260 [Candidatus Saccharimonadia bacterium]|nr:hypothetical protein [Candidatus Saccharimonadia bacterium]